MNRSLMQDALYRCYRFYTLGKIVLLIVVASSSSVAFALDMNILQELVDNSSRGAIIRIPEGIYYGNLEIKKPITLEGEGRVVLDGKGKGSVVKVNSPNVHLMSLEIRNSGIELGSEDSAVLVDDSPRFLLRDTVISKTLFGIQLRASPYSRVENVKIHSYPFELPRRGDILKSWYSPYLEVIGNEFSGGRDMVIWYSDHSKIEKNRVRDGRYGIHFMYSHNSKVKNNIIEDNSVGIYMMYSHEMVLIKNKIYRNHGRSGYGIALKECNKIKILENDIVGNRVGIHSDNSPLNRPRYPEDESIIMSNNISHNNIGFNFIGRGKGLRITKNDFNDNWSQVNSKGVRVVNSKWEKNYWSDYRGPDIDGDGFGTFPYRAKNLFNELTDKYEGFKIFSFGPTIIAFAFAERLIPWLSNSFKFEDQSPRVRRWKSGGRKSINYSFLWVFLGLSICSAFLWRLGKI